MSRIERGRCFRGAIEAEMMGEPFWICFDHDEDCRRAVGGPVMLWVGYRPEQVQFRSGQPKTFSKTPGVVRTFCGTCGTSIGYLDEGLPGEVYLGIGFMNAPERFAPAAHGYREERLTCVQLVDDLPHTDGYTRPRSVVLGNPRDR